MSECIFTPFQEEAITAPCPVLVSAAAGSGKTRVLTERLIRKIRDGEDVDRFLIITFTRAAAAELRGRILAELNALQAADPGNRHYRRQSALLYRAQIGTIDSFCAGLVREHAPALGVTPGFSVLDEERSAALRSRALEEVLDRAYETIGENDGLRLLVDSVGAGRDDRRLGGLVLSLYEQMQSRAWPARWIEEKLAELNVEGIADASETPWGRYLLEEIAGEAVFRAGRLEEALGIMALPGNEPLQKGYGDAFAAAAEQLRAAARSAADSWDRAREHLLPDFPKLGGVRKFPDEALKDRVKAPWDEARAVLKKLRALLPRDSAGMLAGIRDSRPALTALGELVMALDREYSLRKRRADGCDFSDVEHFCVQLLREEETGAATPLAAELSGRFREVMVDEYQDVNAVQELIFRSLSAEGGNLFTVGDVKQSIYRFRLAEPGIFNNRYAAFAAGEGGQRVLLRENFRSRDAVLNACNAVFERIMSPALGEVEYNDEASLVRGGTFAPEGEVLPELCLLDPAAENEEETPDKRRMEARYVAARIREMVERGEPVSDGHGGVRPVSYGDIAVLLRTPGTSGAAFRRAMNEAGIPVIARQGGAFFAQPEVSFTLSMLAVADNPRQDVPLIAALRGIPFRFTPDELAAIRAMGSGDFWDALCLRAETDERCARFTALLGQLRELAREESTESVLRWLYDRTGLMAACAALPDGERRGANLMQLYEYARRFEQDGNRGLFRFVDWMRQLEEKGAEPSFTAAEDSVQILSVHKSKGLEFPVVFLVDNAHLWKTEADAVLCHSDLGFGMRMTDGVRGLDWPTLPWLAIRHRKQNEDLSEQERVLYVAMTRARDRLIMTCVLSKAEEKLAALGGRSDGPIDPPLLRGARCAGDWLLRAAAADDGRTVNVRVLVPDRKDTAPPADEPVPHPPADEGLLEELTERLSWTYPWEGAVSLPSKLTATGVERARAAADPEAASLERTSPVRRFRVPEPGKGDERLTGAEQGVAAHLVMQHIDLARTGSREEIAGEIDRLRREGFLDPRQAETVTPEDILAFFRSAIGRRLLGADRVEREFRFSLLCSANTWFPDAPPGEEVLLQGVVDCCLEEDGALTVIDFKTDARVEPERHAAQLRAYAAAMERVLGRPVRETVLWYLRKKQAVSVTFDEEKACNSE